MYWGEEYVPLRQARRALLTWIGDPRASLRRAKETAQTILGQLDNPSATPAARRELRKVLTDIAYTKQLDADRLERAIFDVFDPGTGRIRRAIGHPAAPLMADSVIEVTKARFTAVTHLTAGKVTDEAFYHARQAHLIAYAEYAAKQRALADSTPPQIPECMGRSLPRRRSMTAACTCSPQSACRSCTRNVRPSYEQQRAQLTCSPFTRPCERPS